MFADNFSFAFCSKYVNEQNTIAIYLARLQSNRL
jgi:hypothetical protein